jgi:glycosyltransferase involved in cell wall biosynthesis
MVRPRVLVITRTLNRPQLLKRCVESVLAQTYSDWLHVIVNDGGDSSVVERVLSEYYEHYRGRQKVIHQPATRGMEAASNTALAAVDSQYVSFLDDDDTWAETFLEEMTSCLCHNPSERVKGVVCQTEVVHETLSDGILTEIRREPFNPSMRDIALLDLLVVNQFTNNAFMVERSAMTTIGPFSEGLPVLGDWDFNIRFFYQYDAVVLQKPLARWHWRQAEGQSANSVHDRSAPHDRWRTTLINEAIRGKWLKDMTHAPLVLIMGSRFHEHLVHLSSIELTVNKIQRDLSEQRTEILQTNRLLSETLERERAANQTIQDMNRQFALQMNRRSIRFVSRVISWLSRRKLDN